MIISKEMKRVINPNRVIIENTLKSSFLCPIGLIIISIVRHSLCYFLGRLIWLITSSALVVFEEDEVKRIIKEEFNK